MTFGFTLTGGRGVLPAGGLVTRLIPWPVKFGMEIFQTASSAWDSRFASHSTSLRTVTVDAGDVGTAEFDLSDERKEALLQSGRTAGKAYLDGFDPHKYVNTYGQTFRPA
jgi:hypothetical protein